MFRLKTDAPTTTIADMPKKHTGPIRYATLTSRLVALRGKERVESVGGGFYHRQAYLLSAGARGDHNQVAGKQNCNARRVGQNVSTRVSSWSNC
jgi:hypothetical protein